MKSEIKTDKKVMITILIIETKTDDTNWWNGDDSIFENRKRNWQNGDASNFESRYQNW